MNITSRQLKAFLLTAQHQSFSRAAEQLFITQSGMSVLVRELEAQLGFRLFERTTRKVTLTEFGAKFLPIADRNLIELESAAATIGRSASAASGSFALGATPFVAAEILPGAIATYGERDAGLHIRLVDADGPRLIEMVQSGEIDVACTAFQQDMPGVRRSALTRFSFTLVAKPGAVSGLARALRWSDIVAFKLIGFPPENPIQMLADEQLRRAGRHAPPNVVCNYLETQIALVESGAGCAVVPSFASAACAKRGMAMYPLVDPDAVADMYWLANRARKLPAAAEGFNRFLKEYFAGLARRFVSPAVKAA
jgi:DNA-binding transcriptional LysR family regulator